MTRHIKIAPSLLAADLARAGEQVNAVYQAGADAIHVDVMDGHFAPNLSFGPSMVQSLHRVCDIPMFVHLMVTDPLLFFKPFAEAGARGVFFHAELDADLHDLARRARALGLAAGVALEMATPAERVADLAGEIDAVVVMTVACGYWGQKLHLEPLKKLPVLRRAFGDGVEIVVDGGVEPGNAGRVAAAGADVLVSGAGVFGTDDFGRAIRALRTAAEAALERP